MDLDELYGRFGEKLYHYLTIKLGSPCDAEDVLQEIFCRLARYIVRLKLIRNPGAFVFHIARNEANRFLRNKIQNQAGCRKTLGLQEVISASILGPDNKAERLLSESLALLPEDQREVIVLKLFEELTFKEIASACDISAHTAASRYRYGIEKLRSILEGKI